MPHNILIVIPARYASKRLPGKPLIKIAGIEMIKRVARIADQVCKRHEHCDYIVATDHTEIVNFCQDQSIPVLLTSEECSSGTERCWDALQKSKKDYDFILNLQGDNPLCPPWFLDAIIEDWKNSGKSEGVYTPYVRLSWEELDTLRAAKLSTPFSGTTVEVDSKGFAITFSKQIIPSIRKEESLRKSTSGHSPVNRHIGLYAYSTSVLSSYLNLPPSRYEKLEGLEQMRFIESRIPIKLVEVSYKNRTGMNGVDSPEDVAKAEAIIKLDGEII